MSKNEHLIYDTDDDNEYGDTLSDERGNLNVPVSGYVVAFVDMGLWNGRPKGGKVMGAYANSIFNVMEDYNRFYCDRWNVRSDLTHHDGTHHCLYRVVEGGLEMAEHLVEQIAYGGMTEEQFKKRTKSLRPYIAKVYGW